VLKYKNKYPIYIVSKGRADVSYTAKMFNEDNLDYKILIEPQEFDEYSKYHNKDKLEVLPFSNLGLGSYPARNYAQELSVKSGAKFHWVFDDNIRKAYKFTRGKRIPCNSALAIHKAEKLLDLYSNVWILGFNYHAFTTPKTRKAFYYNVHVYSCMCMKTDANIKWRLKYNEDVDLCLQALDQGYCTILLNAYCMGKTSTVAKMKGGNQTELYQNNATDKKIQKAHYLQKQWPRYVELKIRFNRPHHYVNWKKYFKQPLIKSEVKA
jgi:hypothetical protein